MLAAREEKPGQDDGDRGHKPDENSGGGGGTDRHVEDKVQGGDGDDLGAASDTGKLNDATGNAEKHEQKDLRQVHRVEFRSAESVNGHEIASGDGKPREY